MDIRRKLVVLADAAKYDASCASSGVKRAGNGRGVGSATGVGICHSYTPDGRCVSLLKILLTNYCVYDCRYCVNRVTSDVERARFTVEEVVWLTLEFYRRNYIEGLFLSSGILKSPDHTMEELVRVARELRTTHAYNGYIHLKAVPGASDGLLAEAGRWADRLSANIELPTDPDLRALAPEKTGPVIRETMGQIAGRIAVARGERKESPAAPNYAPAGQSTQIIVGATPSPDAAILGRASELYAAHRLRRVYYSAYSPIPDCDGRLPHAAPPLLREHRLYQADWLMRFYGFQANELTTAKEPNLEAEVDPKLGWALRHREFFPVDINKAGREAILRVPGIGARNVGRILKIRRWRKIRMEDLGRLRVSMKKVKPFVVTADFNPEAMRIDDEGLRGRVAGEDRQMMLFETKVSSVTGEV